MGLPFFFIFTILISSVQASELENLSKSREWQLLLHYKSGTSETDSPDFFLSEEGKSNPLKELEENIRAYRDKRKSGFHKEDYQCAFPARARFLEENGLVVPISIACAKYQEYLNNLEDVEVWQIFAASFPNNPASVFGHTFLRIKTKRGNLPPDLLDYGLNFAANVEPGDGTLAYAYKGLFGGYRGYYSINRYHEKVLEYAEVESRDMWEFKIELSQNEKKRFVAHLWELLNNSWFDYYFLDENCSYQLFWPLNFARPELQLIDRSALFWTPAETVRKLHDELNGFAGVKERASVKSRFNALKNSLSDKKLEQFNQLSDGQSVIEKVLDAEVIDVYLAFLEWRKSKEGKNDTSLLDRVLKHRASLAKRESPEIKPVLSNPLLAHDSRLVGINHEEKRTRFILAPFSHQIYHYDGGFIPFTEFEFFKFTGDYQHERNVFKLSQVDFFHVSALNAIDPTDKSLSWRVRISSDLRSSFVDAGTGYGFSPFTSQGILYALVKSKVHYLHRGEKRFSPGLGIESGYVLHLNRLKIRVLAEYFASEFIQEMAGKIGTGHTLTRNLLLGVEGSYIRNLKREINDRDYSLFINYSY